MINSTQERLKIAVFIDFDNIAIGVKQSLNRNFDIGIVLEAIKEKGEVVTKIAYGDWKRAEDYSRAMTQHAVQMVQRNPTPGGDKNGADIALALDALEMAFTRNHINAFVIVGGDSDFIALVEKLKQYDKTVFIVGGRAFTSTILQKNCHEFIAYENLIGIHPSAKRAAGKSPASSTAALKNAFPLVRRALKILSDREVSPQLGLLKSTLLQLDSTFSERDYGVSSFRDFIQKLADAGYVNLKQVDRSLLVELKETGEETAQATREPFPSPAEAERETTSTSEPPTGSMSPSEAINMLIELIRESKPKPRWPMYLRSFKQFLRSLQPPADERQLGFSSTYDLVRQAHKDGLLRIERNRQGILRIYPGERYPQMVPEPVLKKPLPADIVLPEPPTATAAQQAPLIEIASDPGARMEIPAAAPEALSESVEFPPEATSPVTANSEEVKHPQVKKPKARQTKKSAPGKTAKTAKRSTRSSKEKTKAAE